MFYSNILVLQSTCFFPLVVSFKADERDISKKLVEEEKGKNVSLLYSSFYCYDITQHFLLSCCLVVSNRHFLLFLFLFSIAMLSSNSISVPRGTLSKTFKKSSIFIVMLSHVESSTLMLTPDFQQRFSMIVSSFYLFLCCSVILLAFYGEPYHKLARNSPFSLPFLSLFSLFSLTFYCYIIT